MMAVSSAREELEALGEVVGGHDAVGTHDEHVAGRLLLLAMDLEAAAREQTRLRRRAGRTP